MRDHALSIWKAAVEAVKPAPLVRAALGERELAAALEGTPRILVLGAGKAGTAMSAAVEDTLADRLERVHGWVNVPAGLETALRRIHLHPARPAGSNHPTEEGVAGAEAILQLARSAGPDDVALCLISGGGSALLPAPAPGVTLTDKQQATQLLHACGATINEMNAVRKHLSAVKGGRLAEAFMGKALYSLIISDVIDDPLDVIASGPTAPDPTTFAGAWAVLERYNLVERVPAGVRERLDKGRAGDIGETPKMIGKHVHNRIIGDNQMALAAAAARAGELGYAVLNLGSFIEGETRHVAAAMAGIVRSIRADCKPIAPPACILSGGETTVTLSPNHGRGGRNQEFVLAALVKLGEDGLRDAVVLSGGTDGEDGPTDAAGALADAEIWRRAVNLDPRSSLARNDAYPFFEAAGGLVVTGLTQTNVMDVRVLLVR
jgi:glycerate 2-kinase